MAVFSDPTAGYGDMQSFDWWNPFTWGKSDPTGGGGGDGQPEPDGFTPPFKGADGRLYERYTDGVWRAAEGIPATPEKRTGGPPEVTIGANGQAWVWSDRANDYVRDPRFDRMPSGPAPQYPRGDVTPTGQTFTINPYTGQVSLGSLFPELATALSPEQQRANALADQQAARAFNTGERLGSQAFSSTERQASQAFTAGENAVNRAQTAQERALDRALTAGQFASQLADQRQQAEFSAARDYQDRQRQFNADRLAAAGQFSQLVNSVDPTALPAFYEAGGGVIANALNRGATALSDKAIAPAAQVLRTSETMQAPSRFTFNWSPIATAPTQAQAAPWLATQPKQNMMEDPNQPNRFIPIESQTTRGGGPLTVASGPNAGSLAATDAGRATANSALADAGVPSWVPRFAFGSGPIRGSATFMSGDSTDPVDPAAGGAHPETVTVNDPTNDSITTVIPNTKPGVGDTSEGMPARFGEVLKAIGEMLCGESEDKPEDGGMMMGGPKRYAYGTLTDPFTVDPADQPYIDRVRALREGVRYPDLNPFSTKFRFTSPTMQQAYFLGQQSRFGVPVADQQAEAARFAVPTTRRGAFSLGL